MNIKRVFTLLTISSLSIFLTACGSDTADTTSTESRLLTLSDRSAVIATNLFGAPGSSALALVDLSADDFEALDGLAASPESDVIVDAFGSAFYRIGRFGINTVTRYEFSDPETPVYEYSIADNEVPDPNPQDMVFVTETKAYILNYNGTRVLIVNPSATSQADFVIGSIDLSVYDEGDGSIEASTGLLVGDQLFITLQRLNFFVPTETAFVVVIDTTTDTEVDTGASTIFNGIPLSIRNPQSISFADSFGVIVQGIGDFGPSFTGGVEAIETSTFITQLLLDDGPEDGSNSPFGKISDAVVVSSTNAYFISYSTFNSQALLSFDPSTGIVDPTPVAGLEDMSIRDITVGPAGLVWVSIADDQNPRVEVINPSSDDSIVDTIATTLNPYSIVFSE